MILIAVLALFIIISAFFCIGLIIVRRKNDKIQTKIQMMTEMQGAHPQSGMGTEFDLKSLPASLPVMDDTAPGDFQRNGLTQEQQMEQFKRLVNVYNQRLQEMKTG